MRLQISTNEKFWKNAALGKGARRKLGNAIQMKIMQGQTRSVILHSIITIHTRVRSHTLACTYTHIHTNAHALIHTHAQILAYAYSHTLTHKHTLTHTNTHEHAHTHEHTHKLAHTPNVPLNSCRHVFMEDEKSSRIICILYVWCWHWACHTRSLRPWSEVVPIFRNKS